MKMLVALDGSPESQRIVRHVSKAAGNARDVDITLYNVIEIPLVREHDGSELSRMEGRLEKLLEDEAERWLADQRSNSEREVLEPARKVLQGSARNSGPAVRLEVAVDTEGDVARKIIEKALQEAYDVVVVGRRSNSGGGHLGSVTAQIVHQLENSSVWVVE